MDGKMEKLFWLGLEMSALQWAGAIEKQWERVQQARDRAATSPDFSEAGKANSQLRFDSHFLLVAIRQVLHAQEAYLSVTGDHRLREARQNFEAAVPNAKDFRDFLEHLGDYMLDRGELQKEGFIGPHPIYSVVITQPSGVRLYFDTRQLDLEAAKEAALELAETVGGVWQETINKAMSGQRFGVLARR